IINPSDIGILVRQGWQGEAIKAELTGVGIKAVTINDAKIFQSREAKAVNYLLQAFDNPSRGNINRALVSEFTSLQTKEIQDLDEDALTDKFRIYKCAWEDHGVYSAIRKFMDEFGVIYNLSQEEGKNGLRSLSNFTQLAEVLQK